MTFNRRCQSLGHTFGSPKYYARNFLFVRHCKRCPQTIKGFIRIVDNEHITVELEGITSAPLEINTNPLSKDVNGSSPTVT